LTAFSQNIISDLEFAIFQVRLIDQLGQEQLKIDKFGFNNKNDVSTRPYWKPVSLTEPGKWYITLAQENWENDPATGEVILTASQTFRFFYHMERDIWGYKKPYLVFNVTIPKAQSNSRRPSLTPLLN
jgi:hypothetical protein